MGEGPTVVGARKGKMLFNHQLVHMFVGNFEPKRPPLRSKGPDPTVRLASTDLRLATTELQPVTRLLDLAVASTKSSSLAPVVGAVVPLMASKSGRVGDEVGWLVKFQKLTPLTPLFSARWVVSDIGVFSTLIRFDKLFNSDFFLSYWFEVGWFA